MSEEKQQKINAGDFGSLDVVEVQGQKYVKFESGELVRVPETLSAETREIKEVKEEKKLVKPRVPKTMTHGSHVYECVIWGGENEEYLNTEVLDEDGKLILLSCNQRTIGIVEYANPNNVFPVMVDVEADVPDEAIINGLHPILKIVAYKLCVDGIGFSIEDTNEDGETLCINEENTLIYLTPCGEEVTAHFKGESDFLPSERSFGASQVNEFYKLFKRDLTRGDLQ